MLLEYVEIFVSIFSSQLRIIKRVPITSVSGESMPSLTPLIEARNLVKQYGDKVAVKDVSFEVYGGEVFGFLGPNGAGKTTTIKMIVGLLQPSSGSVKVAGYDVQTQPMLSKAASGYVPDTPNLYAKLTGRELLRFVADLYDLDRKQVPRRIEELLRMFDLTEAADDTIDSYSHGMQQKASLSAALIHDPRVLVLDEPTVGLDPKSARLIKDILRQIADRGAAVMLSTHILEIAERMCDRIGIIDKGQLVAVGTMDELRSLGSTSGGSSLEDIFLSLTGGAEVAEIAGILK
jgi:ABC-2 type transport system ATP-binding protein